MKLLRRTILFFTICTFALTMGIAQDKGTSEFIGKSFSSVGKKAIPAVVFIKSQANAIASQKSPENYSDPFEYFNDRFRHFFEEQGPRVAQGSGFLVTQDGYIMTNYHVVKDADEITVVLNSGEEYKAKIIGTDSRTDLAIIKIEAKNLPFIPFGNSDALDIGEWVIAIGSPFTLQASLTVGVVSAKSRQGLNINDLEDFIQTDAAINPGNSGGPLLNLNGELIGINAAIVSKSGGFMGIGFAIPSNMAKHVMDQLIGSGSVKRGYLGIYLQEIDKEMAEALKLEKTEGVLISEVIKGSAAEKAGLKEGDVIIEYNDKAVKTLPNFRNEIALLEPGIKLKLGVLRNGKKQSFNVELGQQATDLVASNQTNRLGLEVVDVKDLSPDALDKWGYPDLHDGVLISSVKTNSIAAKAGIRPGMLLLQVNQEKVKSGQDFISAMDKGKENNHMILLVRYHNVTKFISLKLK